MKKVYGIECRDLKGNVTLNMVLFETEEKAKQYVKDLQKLPKNTWKDLKIVRFPLI